MFERLKRVLAPGRADGDGDPADNLDSMMLADNGHGVSGNALSESPSLQEQLHFAAAANGNFSINGKVAGKPWKLERVAASRDYIVGQELRGRADLLVDPHLTVLVMNRSLKELLEKRAYALYTDTLETQASPVLMEEMRWLAVYPETGWDSLTDAFCHRYAVMTSRRADAITWLTPQLTHLLMSWPEPPPSADAPFMLLLMRGKTHLRMQVRPGNPSELHHAAELFTTASASAAATFSPDAAISSKR